jgi:hypothetical protein
VLHGFDFLTPVALGGGAEPRFVTLIVSPYSSIKNLESNFFCFGRKTGKGQHFERIYKSLPFGDIYSVPLPSAKSRWEVHESEKLDPDPNKMFWIHNTPLPNGKEKLEVK